MKRSYSKTVAYYENKQITGSARSLIDERIHDKVIRLRTLNRPVRIFFLGTDEQQDRSGILQALNKLGSITNYTRSDGSYGQNHPGPAALRCASNTERLSSLFSDMAEKDLTPDMLLAQTWASVIDPAVFSFIRKNYGTFVLNIAMDDRHQYWGEKRHGTWGGTFGLIPHIDLTLTAAPECVEWYRKEGCPALYFPEASDPTIFHPTPELPKIYDVSFVGGCYGIRKKIVVALRRAGISVTAYGQGWENGRLSTEDVPRLFAQSKIVLGVGVIGHCTDFYALKLRDFDGPMSGSCYLTHDNPDLRQLYDVGKEIVTYRSVEECIQKVKYLLAHESEREQIARAGRERAMRDHTWDKRFFDLFELLGRSAS